MKRFFSRLSLVILMLLLIQVMSACYQNESTSSKRPSSMTEYTPGESRNLKDTIKIGYSMGTLLEERWLKDRVMFKNAVEELGAEVEIMSANGDDALQNWQAETLISHGIDLLVITPQNAEATAAIVEKAHSAGIKVLSYDRLVNNAEVDMYVSYDNEMIGQLQAKSITSLVPKGNYVYIGGAETDNNAHLLKKGVFEILRPLINKKDITIVFDQWTTNWMPTNAKANMEMALEANDYQIDAVIAANDATAGAVIKVLEEHGLAGEVPVAGQDADLAAIQHIVRGAQAMTVYKPINTLAETAAEVAVKLAKGEEVAYDRMVNNGKVNVPSILLSPIAVNQSNVDETIIEDGFHTKEKVYQSVSH